MFAPMPCALSVLLTLAVAGPLAAAEAPRPTVEAEDEVYRFQPANNGAGPMWCHGSTCLVRVGDRVFAAGLETLPDVPPLNNCRWTLFGRGAAGWELLRADAAGRTREPCPLAAFHGGPLFLSANPTLLTNPRQAAGPSRPEMLRFDPADPKAPPSTLLPQWQGQPPFCEHSYRSLAADGAAKELLLLQNIGYAHAEWSFLDRDGKWSACGKLVWPMGSEYEQPEPVRLCYPAVALKDRQVHFCGVSDIVEPNLQWRAYKKQLTGQNWDYDFRRLFYTRSKDIAQGKFEPWLEVASREKTCGWIMPADLWVAPDGAAHLLWTERALDERLRPKFFPNEKQSHALNYAVVRDGKAIVRRSLLEAVEGGAREIPRAGRFQPTPDNRLFVFCYVEGTDAAGKGVAENRVFEVLPDGSPGPAVRVPLAHPLSSFFTATPRAGSPPSAAIELLGHRVDLPAAISYARVRLVPRSRSN